MPVVVSDASVLISLGATGYIDPLKDFYQTVVVPNAVCRRLRVLRCHCSTRRR